MVQQAENARYSIERMRSKYNLIRNKLRETSLEFVTLRETHARCEELGKNKDESTQAIEQFLVCDRIPCVIQSNALN